MNAALPLAGARVRPRVFRCSMIDGAPRLSHFLFVVLVCGLIGVFLPPLFGHNRQPTNDHPFRDILWGVGMWLLLISPRVWWPGVLRVFPDRVALGGWPCGVTMARSAIIAVERWNGPLFDPPSRLWTYRIASGRWGFGRNGSLGRFRHYVTQEAHAVVIRSATGTPLIVTPDDPDGFVKALGPAAGGAFTGITAGLV